MFGAYRQQRRVQSGSSNNHHQWTLLRGILYNPRFPDGLKPIWLSEHQPHPLLFSSCFNLLSVKSFYLLCWSILFNRTYILFILLYIYFFPSDLPFSFTPPVLLNTPYTMHSLARALLASATLAFARPQGVIISAKGTLGTSVGMAGKRPIPSRPMSHDERCLRKVLQHGL